MVHVKINGRKLLCPGCYSELKLKDFVWLRTQWDPDKEIEDKDYVSMFCRLTGTNFKTPSDAYIQVTIWNCIKWVIEEKFDMPGVPKVIEIEGKIVRIPDDIGSLSIGQMIHIRRRMESDKFDDDSISFAVAVFLQPLYDESDFNIARVKELEAIISDMPAYLAWPIGFFFLKQALNYGKRFVTGWSRIKSSLNSKLSAMRLVWQRLIGLIRSMILT